MVIEKFFTKLVQAIPSWEMTKYYGRVCMFQLRCVKYRMQTSEAWFNFKCKFMPGSIKAEESKPDKSEVKIDPCKPEEALNQTNNNQLAKETQSKNGIWMPQKLNQSKDPANLKDKNKWIPFGRDSKNKKQ